MINIVYALAILIIAIPIGYWLAYIARDELVDGRKWFKIIVIGGILLGIWLFLIGFKAAGYTSFFVSILGIIAYVKSYDKKWIR